MESANASDLLRSGKEKMAEGLGKMLAAAVAGFVKIPTVGVLPLNCHEFGDASRWPVRRLAFLPQLLALLEPLVRRRKRIDGFLINDGPAAFRRNGEGLIVLSNAHQSSDESHLGFLGTPKHLQRDGSHTRRNRANADALRVFPSISPTLLVVDG